MPKIVRLAGGEASVSSHAIGSPMLSRCWAGAGSSSDVSAVLRANAERQQARECAGRTNVGSKLEPGRSGPRGAAVLVDGDAHFCGSKEERHQVFVGDVRSLTRSARQSREGDALSSSDSSGRPTMYTSRSAASWPRRIEPEPGACAPSTYRSRPYVDRTETGISFGQTSENSKL